MTMLPALRSEYRKLVTTRSWWLLLIVMGLYMAFVAGVVGFATGQPAADGSSSPLDASPSGAISVYTVAVALGYVFPVIVGALSVTGEFRHKTITPTLLAEPNRTKVLAAKLLAAIPVGLVYGLVGVAAGVGAGAAGLALGGHQTYLDDGDVLVALARSVLALTVWAVIGVAIGAAIPNQVVVVVVVLAFTQFVEPTLRMLLSSVADGAASDVAKFLPGAAGEALSGSSIYSALGTSSLLTWWQGLIVLVAYAAVFAVIGRLGAFRRDIT